jgi:hypothetical protein
MIKYLKYFLLAVLMVPSMVLAQTFPKPPDVPEYVTVAATYQAGATPNTLGDNSNTWGGTAPYLASMPADIPSTEFPTGWILGTSITYCLTVPVTCPEAKFRTQVNGSHILYDDPIRNYGLPGTSHCHQFFGNRGTNAYSTYARQRTSRGSNAGGGPYNATGYWLPCPVLTNPFADGKNYAVKIDNVIVYYTANVGENAKLSRIPRGLRYILGTNMDDPDDLIVKAEITTANAQPGTAGRYSYIGNGFVGWFCASTGQAVKYLKNTDNTDPFSPTCPAGAQNFYIEFNGPQCWDGTNPWSPGGYKHMRYKIRDNYLGLDVCPNGWYELPGFIGKAYFTLGAFASYSTVRLSSDDPAATAAGHAMRNGESFHTDWFGGWDDTVFMKWQDFCLGINNQTARQCDYSTISATERLLTDSTGPDGLRNPHICLVCSYGVSSAANMYQLPSTSSGPAVINQHQ